MPSEPLIRISEEEMHQKEAVEETIIWYDTRY